MPHQPSGQDCQLQSLLIIIMTLINEGVTTVFTNIVQQITETLRARVNLNWQNNKDNKIHEWYL